MKYASTQIIGSDEVVVVVLPLEMVPLFDPDNPPQPNTYGVPDEVEIGWVKNAQGVFEPPVIVPTVPSRCTRRQGRLALLVTPHGSSSNKLDAAEALIASISDPEMRRKAEIEYECENWERNNLFLQQMWASLGGTPAELDALFTYAVTL